MDDDWDITTGDGSVSLYLPSDFGAELDAHTGDGSIRNDLDARAATGPDKQPPHGQRPARQRRQAASDPHRRRLDPAAPALDATSASQSGCRAYSVGSSHARLPERIDPLPALAARAAVDAVARLHARQCQLERHAQRSAQADRRPPCAATRTAPRSRSACRARSTTPAPSRRRMPASRPETDCRRAVRSGSRADAVRAPCRPRPSRAGRCCGPEVDVLVRRVVRGRLAADRPVDGG